MKKQLKRALFLGLIVAAVWLLGIVRDSGQLREDILRLHVVANSDSEEDQAVKLEVRDAIVNSLQDGLQDMTDLDQAVSYIHSVIPKLTRVANDVLEAAGFDETVRISLETEEFPLREYDTFRLPSGIYQALRVVIGDGEGQNWWCVVFPELCGTATSEEFAQTAGFSEPLAGSLTGEYEIRFWILDQLGKLENFLHRDSESC